jgi:sulfatase modifying factor 1
MKRRLGLALACGLVACPLVAQDRVVITPPDVIWIPDGDFTMGADATDLLFAAQLCSEDLEITVSDLQIDRCGVERFVDELGPQGAGARRVHVGTFGLDRTEVTNRAYRRCVLAGLCAPPLLSDAAHELSEDDHPVVGVRWADAVDYCAFVGGRLPDETEWEKAARGDDPGRRFPWGRVYQSRLANHGRSPRRTDPVDGFLLTAPVGSFPGGASPYGVLDLAGNVWEWTRSLDESGDLAGFRVIRGGSYIHPIVALRVTMRSQATTDSAQGDLGFRCAYDPPPHGADRAVTGP